MPSTGAGRLPSASASALPCWPCLRCRRPDCGRGSDASSALRRRLPQECRRSWAGGRAPASFGIGGLAAWVPAVTTISASLTAYIAASRYDHQIVEFLRTAEQLERLRHARAAEAMADAAFVDACEEVISVENQGWMTQWTR